MILDTMDSMTVPQCLPQSAMFYEKLGDQFDACMSLYDVGQRLTLIAYFLSLVPPPPRCLETGCGTGKISALLHARIPELTVTDISERLSRSVGERLGCAWRQEDVSALRFEDASFDAVVSSECIEHTGDPVRALSEMCRVLKPGGFLILTTPNRLWYPVLVLSQALRIRKFDGPPEHWLWPHTIMRVLREHGLAIRSVRGCHLYPWQIPFFRRCLPLLDRGGAVLWPMMINVGFLAIKR